MTGKLHRVLDPLVRSRSGRNVLRVLCRLQEVGEQRAKLHFAPGTARLDVGQHAFQVPDARSEHLHLTQTPVHLFEPLRHVLERRAEALFEGRLQLFVDRRAHLVELVRVFLAQQVEPLLERLAQHLVPRLERLRHLPDALLLPGERRGELLAQPRAGSRVLVTRGCKVAADIALMVRRAADEGVEVPTLCCGVARIGIAFARQRTDSKRNHDADHDQRHQQSERRNDQNNLHFRHAAESSSPSNAHHPWRHAAAARASSASSAKLASQCSPA